jgi:AcrR family transcriptional regulator
MLRPVATARPSRRPRRPAAEVREQLRAAARDLFLSRGFTATTTKEIADRADTSEAMLFRYCGGKVQLFETVILQPFQDFMSEYLENFEQMSTRAYSTEDVVRRFVTGLYMLLRQHRDLLLTLCAARLHDQDPLHEAARDVGRQLAELLGRMEHVTRTEETAHELHGMDPTLTSAAGIGTVMALALLDDWLIPADRSTFSAGQVTNEITTLILHGITHRNS